ncbi:MAG: hypothetical protein BRC26_00760 [Nanohaloarchaea archaeon QH_8_44_6]|nr:MAG: hypothetical protein BRC26_00760 [Nanohaloarchaea archaeon QH_8_44_6]
MTQNFDVFAKRKGQSAIEYLMTYGWMLLVVAIVGGAIFATVQGQCTTSTSGFSTSDVRVADFATTSSGELAFELRNAAANPVNVTDISVEGNSGAITEAVIPVGSSSTFSTSIGATSVDGCNDFDLSISYDVEDGIGDQVVNGTMTDSISLN